MIRCLWIDDDLDFLIDKKAVFEDPNFHIEIETSPIMGLKRLDTEDYSLIIVDLSMSELPGDKLIAEIDKRNPDIPIFISSAFIGTIVWHSRIEAVNKRVTYTIKKPIAVKNYEMYKRNMIDYASSYLAKSLKTN
jgi:DNA-binding NtrC family response regulator